MDHKTIKDKIESIPNMCKEGKKLISDLFQEFGYVPPKDELYLEEGVYFHFNIKQIFFVKNNRYRWYQGVGSDHWTPVTKSYFSNVDILHKITHSITFPW